jgi:transposase
MKQEIEGLEKEIQQAFEKTKQADEQEEGAKAMLPESVNEEIRDRQARLSKIKEALKQLEERKPETESLCFEHVYKNNITPWCMGCIIFHKGND